MTSTMACNENEKIKDNGDPISHDEEELRFKWEELPYDVYEKLVEFLHGTSLINLCLCSPYLADRILEPINFISSEKREKFYHQVCVRDLDPSLVGKIFSSFMTFSSLDNVNKAEARLEVGVRGMVSWESVFNSYMSCWSVLINGPAKNERLKDLENKLKAEMLCAKQAENPPKKVRRRRGKSNAPATAYALEILSGGGKIFLNAIRPCPPPNLNSKNVLVAEVAEDVRCKYEMTLCPESRKSFGLKIVHFPLFRNKDGIKILDFEGVVLGACNECITVSPLLRAGARIYKWEQHLRVNREIENEYGGVSFIENSPIFEVFHNVIAVWPRPETLLFLLMEATSNQDGYTLCEIYRLTNTDIEDTCKRMLSSFNAGHYIPVLREYEGDCPGSLIRKVVQKKINGGSGYIYHPTKPVYYGLEVASPIYGLITIKPTVAVNGENATAEKCDPYFYPSNEKKYRHRFCQPFSSGKGHGTFVACSGLIVAASKNGVIWIFGELTLPNVIAEDKNAERVITRVEVANANHGLILVVNEDIILAEMRVHEHINDKLPGSATEPDVELMIKPLRLFQTNLAFMYKEIAHLELNFDQGQPFFMIVAKNRRERESFFGGIRLISPHWDEFSLSVVRVDFA